MYKYATVLLMILLATTRGYGDSGDLKMEILSTGLSSGHIADIQVVNEGTERYTGFAGPFIIFSGEKYAPLWVDRFYLDLLPGKNRSVAVQGTTLLFTLPIPPKGHKTSKSMKWYDGNEMGYLLPDEDLGNKNGISRLDPDKLHALALTYPGTGIWFPYRIDPFLNPADFSRFMLEAETWIRLTYKRLKSENKINTVLSGDPGLEEDFLTQILSWTVSGMLTGDPFEQKELYEQVLTKYLQATNSKEKKLSGKVLQILKKGSEDIWQAVLYNGREAGLLINDTSRGDRLQAVTYRGNTGICVAGQGGKSLLVEDPAVCSYIGGKFTPGSADQFTSSPVPESPVELENLDHLIGVGNELELNGQLKGALASVDNLYVSISNKGIASYKVGLNKKTGKFRFSDPSLAPGENEVLVKAVTNTGASIPVLKSVFTIEQDTIRVVQGGSITIDRRSVFLRSVRASSILLYDGSVSYPLMRGSDFALNGAEISLYKLAPDRKSAFLIIKRKICSSRIRPIEDLGGEQQEGPWRDKTSFTEQYGYKGILLPPELGTSIPGKRVLAVVAGNKVSPDAVVCGWQMTDHLRSAWGGLLSKSLMRILTDMKQKNPGQMKDVEVIYVDTLSRQVAAHMLAGPFPESGRWLRKKLINPDYVLDGEVRFSCCKVKRAPTCTGTSVKVELYVRLIETRTGRVVTTYSKGLERKDVEDDLICMDFYSKGSQEYRDLIIEEFTKNATDYIREYMAGRW